MRPSAMFLCLILSAQPFGLIERLGTAFGAEWNMFRGPNGSGTNQKLDLPSGLNLSSVKWKIDAGKGGSSIIAFGSKMFLTSFDDDTRYLKCIDSTSGKELWVRKLPKLRKETATPPNDPAICTPVCDETFVCAFFPDAGMLVTNLEGDIQWQKDLGPFYSMHGISASPIISNGKLILSVDQLRDSYIVALDIKNGTELWKSERLIGITGGYSTPVVMKWNNRELVISASPGELVGYDLASGDKLLSCTGITNAPVGLPVIQGNHIYFCEPPGEPIPMEALGGADKNKDGVIELEEVKNSLGTFRLIERIDNGFGNGDGKVDQAEWTKGFGTFLNNGGLSCIELFEQDGKIESKVLWKYSKSTPYIPSLLIANKFVYMINDGGILIVFD
ncbi:MAG: PQQ-binding-like beta-propeller repeat protein, partial [Pirellula sp.]